MPQDRYTLGQHMAAVGTVIALSLVMTGLVEMGAASMGRGMAVETPVAEDLGGIRGPAAPEWGHTVLRLAGMR